MENTIIVQARMPRVIVGFAIGCALGTGGAVLQGMVRNQMADPFVLGASYGAASFATLGLAVGWFGKLGIYQLPVNGCIGAILALAFILIYSMRRGRIDVNLLLLGGVGFSLFFKALVQFIMKMNPRAFATGSSAFWTEGGLAAVKYDYMKWPLMIILACICCLGANYRSLNAIQCGEDTAQTLGVAVKPVQKAMVIVTSLMIGISVAISGGIGFVGLIAPNFARMLVGSNYRKTIPLCAVLGGVFLIWCDVLARTLFAPVEISVGIVTSIIGGPIFLIFLKKGKK